MRFVWICYKFVEIFPSEARTLFAANTVPAGGQKS